MGHVMVLPELRDVDEIQPLGVGAPEIVWAYRVSALQPQVAIEDEPPGCRLLAGRETTLEGLHRCQSCQIEFGR
jgi:hypothetical protein